MSTNNAAHTPGPWETFDDEEGHTFIFSRDGVRIARVFGQQGPWHEANADLIVAAPELLEALRELSGIVISLRADNRFKALSNERTNMLSAWLLASEKAIAKATGSAK